MALNSETFLARAKDCDRDAENCSLPQVKERFVRAASVWRTMGENALQFEQKQAVSRDRSGLLLSADA